jgi:hypothetical protein
MTLRDETLCQWGNKEYCSFAKEKSNFECNSPTKLFLERAKIYFGLGAIHPLCFELAKATLEIVTCLQVLLNTIIC